MKRHSVMFFDRLVIDRVEEEAKAREDSDDDKNDEEEEDAEVVDLTVPWLSKFFMEMFDMEKVPFQIEGETNETLLTALSEKIAQEIQSVERVRKHVAFERRYGSSACEERRDRYP